MTDRFFEEVQVGVQAESPGRTITEADLVTLAAVSGDYDGFGADETSVGVMEHGRIASPLLGSCVVTGLAYRAGRSLEILAFLGGEWRFHGAIRIGDTLRVRIQAVQKRDLTGRDGGVVIERWDLLNQRDELVQEARVSLLVAKRNAKE